MKRAYGYRSLAAGNTAQPVFGAVTSVAVPAGGLNPNVVTLATVGDTSLFDQGQWAIIDVGALEERVMVFAVNPGVSITIQVPGGSDGQGCRLAHASGVAIRPSRLVSNISIQTQDGNVNPLFICTGTTGKTDGTACTHKLQNVPAGQQPTAFQDAFTSESGPNPIDMAEYWIVGTTIGDKWLPSIGVV